MALERGVINFYLLMIGQFVAVIGDRISTVVFITIAVAIVGNLDTTFHSPLLVSVQILPFFLFGYFFGLMADKVEKRKILIFADIFRSLTLIFLFFFHDSLITLYSVVFIIGFLTSMFEPARKSILPFLVERKNLVFYNKFYATAEIVAMMIGLGVGTFLLKYITIERALILNATTYLFSMTLILFIKYHDYTKENSNIKDQITTLNIKKALYDLKEGFIYLKSQNNVKYVIINIILFHFFAAAFFFSTANDFGIRNASITGLPPGSNVSLVLLIVAIGAIMSFFILMYTKSLKDSTLSKIVYKIGSFLLLLLYILTTFFKVSFYWILPFFFLIGIIAGIQYLRFLYIIHLNTDKKYLGRVISVAEITWSLVIVLGLISGAWINQELTYQYGFLGTSIIYALGALSFKFTEHKITW